MYCILDTETTSLHPWQIAQLSYSLIDSEYNHIVSKNFFFTVDEMHPGAEAVHGFSQDMLAQLSENKTFSDSIDEIASDLRDRTLIVHNVPFDRKFLQAEFKSYGIEPSRYNEFCTMNHFTPICNIILPWKYTPKRPKVSEVLDFLWVSDSQVLAKAKELYGSDDIGFHDARFDTAALVCALDAYGWEKALAK